MSQIQNKKLLLFRDVKFKISNLFRISDLEFRISRFAGGFALVELLIAVALFGIITAFVLLAYGRVGEQLFIGTVAYETALSFRQAQSYGVSVRQVAGGFDAAYGLHFEKKQGTEGREDTRFVLFADTKPPFQGGHLLQYDGTHDESGCVSISASECILLVRIERGNRIEKFCGVRAQLGTSEECDTGTETPIEFLDVSFLRPNPDAKIRSDKSIGEGERYKAARIYLISPSGLKKTVEVWTTGQISIK